MLNLNLHQVKQTHTTANRASARPAFKGQTPLIVQQLKTEHLLKPLREIIPPNLPEHIKIDLKGVNLRESNARGADLRNCSFYSGYNQKGSTFLAGTLYDKNTKLPSLCLETNVHGNITGAKPFKPEEFGMISYEKQKEKAETAFYKALKSLPDMEKIDLYPDDPGAEVIEFANHNKQELYPGWEFRKHSKNYKGKD